MDSIPPLDPAAVRLSIIDALKDPQRRFLSRDDHTSRNYLDLWGIKAHTFFEDLANDLMLYELYLKPASSTGIPQKYQYILTYPEEHGYPEVIVHVTLSPRGEPVRVKIAVHPHNTGYTPLPRIPINR